MNAPELARPSTVYTREAFAGRVFLITGAGRGVARAAALRLAAYGAMVAACDLVAARAEDTAQAILSDGGKALAVPADVGDEAAVSRVVEQVVDRWKRIDVLVNAAGSYGVPYQRTHETPLAEWEQVFASNVRGTFLCAKAVLPHMMQAGGGRIINFASNAARSVSPMLGCSYTAAKTAVVGITRHLSREYAGHGILVNTIAPGPVDGERVAGLARGDGDIEAVVAQIPLGRLAEPADIVDAMLFLASDASRFMTGAILDVSGGLILT